MSEDIIVREGEGWRYTFDVSRYSEYDVVTLEGDFTAEVILDLAEVMEGYIQEHHGPEAKFPPHIIDLSQARLSISALPAVKTVGRFRDRHRLAVVIADEETMGSTIYHLFTQFSRAASTLAVQFVRTMDEALEAIQQYWEQHPRE